MTGWRAGTRLARDHYIRFDSNDYSVHPAVIGRRIETTADLARVWVRRPVGQPARRGPPQRTVADRADPAGRYPLLITDEVGYIPFEAEAANLFFQLVSSRYEKASLIVTSNKVFGRWGEVFGDDVVAAAMIDRLVHHAEVLASRTTATGSKTETSAASQPQPPPTSKDQTTGRGSIFRCRQGVSLRLPLTLAGEGGAGDSGGVSGWCWRYVSLSENSADRRSADAAAKFEEFFLDSLVTPVCVLLSHSLDQCSGGVVDGRAPGSVRIGPLVGDQARVPALLH